MGAVTVESQKTKPLKIILWWEIRRLAFNAVLIALIAIALKILGLSVWEMEMGSGDYFILLIFIGHLLVVNLIYTLGWLIALSKPRNPNFSRNFLLTVCGLSLFGLIAITGSLAFLLWS